MLRWRDDAGSDAGGAKGAPPVRVAAAIAWVALVVLAAVAAGYAFYLALLWVASEGARRGAGA